MWKFEDITIDFASCFPLVNGKDAVWFIMDRLTKVAHFISILFKPNVEELAVLYVEHIMRLHGMPKMIVSNRDPSFTLLSRRAYMQPWGQS